MAGLEVVVRPVVFPSIRPQAARVLPPADDPEKGFAVIHGNGGKHIDLNHSWSISASKSKPKETQRRVDEARVYQMDDDGEINEDNFIDIEIPNKIWMEGGKLPAVDDGSDPATEDAPTKSKLPETSVEYYRPVQEEANIEVKKRNFIRKSGEETGPI